MFIVLIIYRPSLFYFFMNSSSKKLFKYSWLQANLWDFLHSLSWHLSDWSPLVLLIAYYFCTFCMRGIHKKFTASQVYSEMFQSWLDRTVTLENIFHSSIVLRLTNPLECLPTSALATFSQVLCKSVSSKRFPLSLFHKPCWKTLHAGLLKNPVN